MESCDRMLNKMDDPEKGQSSRARFASSPNDKDDFMGNGFRLWMSDMVSFVVLPAFFVLLVLIIGFGIALRMTEIPGIYLGGKLSGPINITLANGGHGSLHPDIDVTLKIGIEKGLTHDMSGSSTSASAAGGPSIVIRGRRFRLRILGIIALTVIPVLSVLVVLLITVFIILRLANIPGIYIVGKLNGPINATLGSLGHAVLYPDLDVNLRLGIGY